MKKTLGHKTKKIVEMIDKFKNRGIEVKDKIKDKVDLTKLAQKLADRREKILNEHNEEKNETNEKSKE